MVTDVAVAGAPDAHWGTRLVAYVVVSPEGRDLEPARLLAELRELVSAELAAFAAPRELVVVDELPRTAIGKVSRAELQKLEGPRALVG
jgi:acyl-coenzyme A synthetase/AMP-(fatty) acid ligase